MSKIDTVKSNFNKINSKQTGFFKNSLSRNNDERKEKLSLLAKENTRVKIPDAVKDFARIKIAVDKADDIDNSAKIEKLKNLIAKGEYKFDFNKLADKIIENDI